MSLSEAVSWEEPYDAALVVIGLAIIASAALPRLLHEKPLSFPIPLLGLGVVAFALPIGLPDPDPLRYPVITERLTELLVIVALANAGLKIDRDFSWRGWSSTWRLLAICMPLTILAAAVLGWWIVGFAPATAALLGACISPTDPVLASEVQVGGPGHGSGQAEVEEIDLAGEPGEDEVRFALTSEAGLNDGLAFPYTNLAIAMALAGASPSGWLGSWLLVDVVYKLGMGLAAGWVIGRLLGRLILAVPARTETGRALTGMAALGLTFGLFGVTEFAGGYGFLATFVGAHVARRCEPDHEYHEALVLFIEQIERVLIALVLVLLGGAVARGLLGHLTWRSAVVAVLLVALVRPATGLLSLAGTGKAPWRERAAIAFFGIRGVGSFYYLAHGLNEEDFSGAEELWALVALVAVISTILHGATASTALRWLDERRERDSPE